jgi:CDP-4-dehydro-6-deoxyglucose reductase, E3
MPSIHVNGSSYGVEPNETVLDCLDRHGVVVMSSCRVGVCQSCMVRAVDGEPPAAAQKGLRDTVAAQGFFLACSARIETDITLDLDGVSGREVRARVSAIDRLNDRVVRLRCEPNEAVEYAAGQFMNLIGPDGSVRSYSVASVPADPYLEFQVMLMPGGKVSTWVHNELKAGDVVPLVGPQGACSYTPGRPDQPMLLAGTGTGLAPLYGILRDALAHQHTGPIHLFHGSVRSDGLYLVDELRALAANHENVQYYPCALESGGDDDVVIQPIDAYIDRQFPDLEGYRAFLCGHPDLVKKLQRQSFLAGADMGDIYADAFLPAAGS